ncbi:ferritin-like domain-containing protein [Hymenobacter sp. M29]|uniref:Ferritin-like domain-containing protein n=1 Tax=Hymenobacter mellowenesis TaxID=3063995 RepID=A0ABT9AC07_9BACT|nr:ferritin-like domain-containing protein [Hymenobacter sp. M29]MDO7846262.1 ferritin-like domain-containing protein [Hymenobacter sp. M29]
MNIFQIITEIEKIDPEVYDRLDSRRSIFRHMGGLGQKLTAAAVPLALGAVLNKAYAQTSAAPSVADVLNFALKLEHLEANFYNLGLGNGTDPLTTAQNTLRNGFSANNLSSLLRMRADENNHVQFLRDTLAALGATAIPVPALTQFDFTGGRGSAGGPFATVFTSAATFLAVAQSLEDTGVRAYKGGAPYLMGNKTVLEAALNIHSVEARHASRLRTMRRAGATNNTAATVAPATVTGLEAERTASPKSWVSGKDNGGAQPAQTAAIYNAGTLPAGTPTGITFPAEDNFIQGGLDLRTTTTVAGIPLLAFSEAFDEPLDVPSVNAIARTFTVASSTLFA